MDGQTKPTEVAHEKSMVAFRTLPHVPACFDVSSLSKRVAELFLRQVRSPSVKSR